MNKLSEEQKNDLLSQYDVNKNLITKLEKILEDLNIEDFEYYILINDIVSEYQSFKINKELKSSLATPYKGLKDIVIKVLNYKLKGVTEERINYENEVRSLVLRLTEK